MITQVDDIEKKSSDWVLSQFDDDTEWIRIANGIRLALIEKPSQSFFRVIALMIISQSEGNQKNWKVVCGSNHEQGYIGGAICAERAAICRLRFYPESVIEKVIVVTDSQHPISPGALCREFLMSLTSINTPVVMGNHDGSLIAKCPLSDLYPHPYLYRVKNRADVVLCAESFKELVSSKPISYDFAEYKEFYDLAFRAAKDVIEFDFEDLHPIRFAASVVFSDKSTSSAYLLKGLEYGCSVDPVSQLINSIESKKRSKIDPVMIVIIDQFGTLHAPFAAARSQLVERGHGNILLPIHGEDGSISLVLAKTLFPTVDGVAKALTHDDFLK